MPGFSYLSAGMRKRLKIGCVAGAALFSLLAAGCGVRSAANGSFDRTFKVNGPVHLEITNNNGDSRITAGAPGEVHIHGEFHVKSWSSSGGHRRMEEIESNPPISQDGDMIRIGVASGSHAGGRQSGQIDYTIVVPPDAEVRGITGSGDLSVGGVRGPIPGSAQIRAEMAAPPVTVTLRAQPQLDPTYAHHPETRARTAPETHRFDRSPDTQFPPPPSVRSS